MKFDELCKFVLINEADYDYISGTDKVYSIGDDAENIVKSLELNNIKELIRKTTLPFEKTYLIYLVIEDLMGYLPAETSDVKDFLKRSIWIKFEDSEKKSKRAADILFAFLKKNKIIVPGIPKKKLDKDEIERIAKDIEATTIDVDEIEGLSIDDVSKLGGVLPRTIGHEEDESEWGSYSD